MVRISTVGNIWQFVFNENVLNIALMLIVRSFEEQKGEQQTQPARNVILTLSNVTTT